MLRVTYYGLLIFNFDPPTGGFVRACPEFNSGMTATISVILNLIQNQLDPDFRQDDRRDYRYSCPPAGGLTFAF